MIRVVKLCFQEEFIANFKRLFDERKDRIKNVAGCEYLELWQDEKHAHIFYTYSHWSDAGYLEAYRTSSLFQETWAIIKPWFSDKPEAYSATKLMVV